MLRAVLQADESILTTLKVPLNSLIDITLLSFGQFIQKTFDRINRIW